MNHVKYFRPRREWYNVELPKTKADLLKLYLNEHGIYFEPSEMYYLIHFEVLMNEDEASMVNRFLDLLGRDPIGRTY